MGTSHRIFISCVTGELGGVRQALRKYLARADCEVNVQEELPQSPLTTLEKLDAYIRRASAVLHLTGRTDGACANPDEVGAYLRSKFPRPFLDAAPPLRDSLRPFQGIPYSRWEALIALHHSVPLFVYRFGDESFPSRSAAGVIDPFDQHLSRAGRYPELVADLTDLLGKLLGDLRTVLSSDAGNNIVTDQAEALGLQERYAAMNDVDTVLKLHGLTFVLIPPATVLTEGKRYSHPPANATGVPLFVFIAKTVLEAERCRALVPGTPISQLSDVEPWLRAVGSADGTVRLPTSAELRHASRLGLIELAPAGCEELCRDGDRFHALMMDAAEAEAPLKSLTNTLMTIPAHWVWRLVLAEPPLSRHNLRTR